MSQRREDDLAYGDDYGSNRGYYDQSNQGNQGGQGQGDRGIIGDTFKKLKSKYDQRQGQRPPQDFGYGAPTSSASSTYAPPGSSGYTGGGGYGGDQSYQQQYSQNQGQYGSHGPHSGNVAAQQSYQSQGQGTQQKPDIADKLIGGLFGSVTSIVGDVQKMVGHGQKPGQGQGQYGQPGPPQAGLQSNLQSSVPGAKGSNRYNSTFEGPKPGHDVKWYVDGAGYMWAVSQALENARHTIWILDWWLSPELYLRRPPARNEEWRIDRVLQRAANRGVKINIIVYKEVTQALTLSSAHTKHVLEALSPNIGVFRHPDHLPDAQTTHSSITSAFQSLKLDAAGMSKLGADTLKGVYGLSDDVILYWAHHEKLCIVDGNIAFMGGLDLCYGRWDTNQHPISDAHPSDLNKIVFPGQDFNNARVMDFSEVDHPFQNKLDRTKSSRMGWSDISICIHGPCVGDLIHHFVDRWNFIYDEKYNVRSDKRYTRLPPFPGHHDNEVPAVSLVNKPQASGSTAPGQQAGSGIASTSHTGGYQQPSWQTGQGAPTPGTSGVGAATGTYGAATQSGQQQPQYQTQHNQQQGNFPPPPPGPPPATMPYGQPQTQSSFPPPPVSSHSEQQQYQSPQYSGSQAQPVFPPPPGSNYAEQQQQKYDSNQSSYLQTEQSVSEQAPPAPYQSHPTYTQAGGDNTSTPQTAYISSHQQHGTQYPGSTNQGNYAQGPQSGSMYGQTPQTETFSPLSHQGTTASSILAAPEPHDYSQRPTTPQQQAQQSQTPQQQQQQVQQQYAAYHPPESATELPSQSAAGYQAYNPQGTSRGFEGTEGYGDNYSGERGFSGSDYDQSYAQSRGYGEEHEYGGERAFGIGSSRPQGKPPTQGSGPGQGRFEKYKGEAIRLGNQLENKYGDRVQGEVNKFTGGRYGRPQSRAGGMSCQLVRSCTKWSNGTATEHSVQNAYIDLIQNAQHFIYIENQFFITATGDHQKPVKNQIGKALVERIVRAARSNQPFKVIVNIPAVPAFAGDLVDDASLGTRAIMEFQYNSICRGGHSIMEEVQKAGINPMDYIRFYNLRNYDRINITPAMVQAQQQTGVGYDDARRQFEGQLGSGYGGYGEQAGQSAAYAAHPGQQGPQSQQNFQGQQGYQSQQGQYQYQQAAQHTATTGADRWDTVSSCYMLNGQDIRSVPWTGPPEAELDAFVSEELYIHSKVMIVDDQTVICGSANLNDRSMLGTHDSEIALIINDPAPVQSSMAGRPWQASRFAASLRRQLFRKHLGLIGPQDMQYPTNNFLPVGTPNNYDWGSPEDNIVSDPLADGFQSLWNTRARTNTEVFRKAFRAVPDDNVRSWPEYKEFYEYYFAKADGQAGGKDPSAKVSRVEYGHVVRSDFPGGVQELKELLSRVKGTIVEMPLCFLQTEDIAKENLSFNALTAELYT